MYILLSCGGYVISDRSGVFCLVFNQSPSFLSALNHHRGVPSDELHNMRQHRPLQTSQSPPTSDFTPRYLRNDLITNLGKSRLVGAPTECWLSIYTVGINSK